jgi:predicted SprT family Zn-dependent metalloprotease
MNINEAKSLAERLMREQGLADWRFAFDRARRRFGCCWPTRKLITLSRPLTELNDEAEVRDTILHEIAHALVPGGHTAAWRKMCVRIGAVPRRCYTNAAVKLPEIQRWVLYVAVCRCPMEHVKKRRPNPRRTYICRKCRVELAWERRAPRLQTADQ